IADRLTILYVGRLEPEKRVGDIVTALRRVRDECDAQLLIVGVGSQQVRLRRLAAKMGLDGHVLFAGHVSERNLLLAYAGCEVLCNPSVAELQSIVALEAMAVGRAV